MGPPSFHYTIFSSVLPSSITHGSTSFYTHGSNPDSFFNPWVNTPTKTIFSSVLPRMSHTGLKRGYTAIKLKKRSFFLSVLEVFTTKSYFSIKVEDSRMLLSTQEGQNIYLSLDSDVFESTTSQAEICSVAKFVKAGFIKIKSDCFYIVISDFCSKEENGTSKEENGTSKEENGTSKEENGTSISNIIITDGTSPYSTHSTVTQFISIPTIKKTVLPYEDIGVVLLQFILNPVFFPGVAILKGPVRYEVENGRVYVRSGVTEEVELGGCVTGLMDGTTGGGGVEFIKDGDLSFKCSNKWTEILEGLLTRGEATVECIMMIFSSHYLCIQVVFKESEGSYLEIQVPKILY